jgi:hypothetical protein
MLSNADRVTLRKRRYATFWATATVMKSGIQITPILP